MFQGNLYDTQKHLYKWGLLGSLFVAFLRVVTVLCTNGRHDFC